MIKGSTIHTAEYSKGKNLTPIGSFSLDIGGSIFRHGGPLCFLLVSETID